MPPKTKHKSKMKIEQINSDMRININGPIIPWFIPKTYLSAYTSKHLKCDPELNDSRAAKKLKNADQTKAEELGKAYLSGKSALF